MYLEPSIKFCETSGRKDGLKEFFIPFFVSAVFPTEGCVQIPKEGFERDPRRQSHACATIFSPGKNIWNVDGVSA